MKTNYQIIRKSLLALALVTALAPHNAHALGSTPVTVVNPTPIAVSGAVTVANPVSVTGTVTIANPADIAKAQDIQHPFQARITCADSGIGIRCSGTYGVPADQRLVIEYVSASCRIDNTKQLLRSVGLQTTSGGVGLAHLLSFPDRIGVVGDSGAIINEINFGQQVRLYADAGTNVRVFADTNVATSSLAGNCPNCYITLSGLAVSVP